MNYEAITLELLGKLTTRSRDVVIDHAIVRLGELADVSVGGLEALQKLTERVAALEEKCKHD